MKQQGSVGGEVHIHRSNINFSNCYCTEESDDKLSLIQKVDD
jgi:hypothetical protein